MKTSVDDQASSGVSSWDGRDPRAGDLVTERIRLVRPLGAGGMGAVWVGEHLSLGIEIAVKFVREVHSGTVERLAREARLAAMVDHPHAVRVIDQGVTSNGLPFLVMELLDGESLGERLRRAGPLTVEEVVALATQVGSALDAAHELGIVHRDVKPDNILLLAGGEGINAKLIDFGIARPVDLGFTTITRAGQIVGTPVYMSPEQLLEVRPADVAADLWALAVVIYESLAGRRPFDAESLAGVVVALMQHRHEPITVRDPGLPGGLDAFFARAFNEDPAMRFTSAGALAEAFVAAAADERGLAPADRGAQPLRIPDRLYGRDAEIARLDAALAEASAGKSRAVLVAGYSGTGKTSLVLELRRRLYTSPVAIAVGKFDQFDRGRPYHSLIQAFRHLIQHNLARRDTSVATWRDRLLESIGDGGRVLTNIISELDEVIGPQPELDDVAPEEQRARFQQAMARLVAALAMPERPLVVFCDDVQWADLSSLDLLTSLATDPESRHVLLVCAYRDNELGPAHPLLPAIANMRAGGRLDEIVLGPLDVDAVLDLVTDTFPGLPGRMRLATAAHAKTRGNAFFLRRFLENLVERGLVRNDPGASRWSWDAEAVEALDMPEDVIDFVADEIGRMPAESRRAMAVAACIGDRFELGALAHALGCDHATTLERIRAGLVGELLTATGTDRSTATRRLVFHFAHDRVRQAARGAIDDTAAAAIHRSVGRFFLDHLEVSELDSRLFEVVEHLNRGGTTDLRPSDRARLCALNLEAGRRAVRSAAFEVGDAYFRQARSQLDDDPWSVNYAQTHAIFVEGARAAYLAGDHGEMDALLDVAVQHAREVLHRLAAQEVRIQARLSQQRFADALGLALDALKEIGVEVPREPTAGDVEAAVGATLAAVQATSQEDLARIPISDDPVVRARMRIQTGAMSSAYMAAPSLLPILACNIVRATLDQGVCKESPYGFAVLGLVLNAVNLMDAAHSLGRIAFEMLDRVGERSTRPRTLHVLAAHVMPFVEPLRDWVPIERQVARLGFDTGDLEYAAWGLHCEVCNGFYAGAPLDELAPVFERNRASLEHHRQMAALGCTLQYGRAIACLRGEAADPESLSGPDYDEAAQMAAFRAANFRGAGFILAVLGAYVRFVFRDLAGAIASMDAGAELADGAPATYHLVWWRQIRSLAALGAVDTTSAEAVAAVLADVAPHVEQLRTWHRASEANHGHRMHMVDGGDRPGGGSRRASTDPLRRSRQAGAGERLRPRASAGARARGALPARQRRSRRSDGVGSGSDPGVALVGSDGEGRSARGRVRRIGFATSLAVD